MSVCGRSDSIRSSSAADSSCSYSQHVTGKTFEVIVRNELVNALADWEPELAISKRFSNPEWIRRARAALAGNQHYVRLFDRVQRDWPKALKARPPGLQHSEDPSSKGCAFTEVEADVWGTVLPKELKVVSGHTCCHVAMMGCTAELLCVTHSCVAVHISVT
jgi:hypothetical protein